MASQIKFSIGIILCLLLLRGSYDLAFNNKSNSCEMTYMYEYPKYIKIELPDDNETRHQYGLYAYGEGKYAKELAKGIFNGVPILFIPGNQGSFKQVRSLGSIAYRKSIDENHDFHFNFFSVDFNEELGAFYGPVLERQTQFVSIAIRKILQIYNKSNVKPISVILVGHSMGGLIARAVVTLPEIPASYVSLIISQATPQVFPVIVPDSHIIDFYDKVNYHWKIERFKDFMDIVLVSIGAGKNDFQVSNFYTSSDLVDVDVSTLGVPSCWLTMDHLAIVWCKQLALATVRGLFDSVNSADKKISQDRNHIIEAFKYQLVQRGGPKRKFPIVYPPLLTNFDRNGHWSEMGKRQFQHQSNRTTKSTFLMIPLRKSLDSYQHINIIGKNLSWINWVFACKADMLTNQIRVCSTGENLSENGRIIIGSKKEINIKTNHLIDRGHTHLVVWLRPSDEKVQVAVDVSDLKTRQATVDAPRFMSSFQPVVVIAATPSKALTFNVTIKDLTEPWQSFTLSVRPKDESCARKSLSRPYVSVTSTWFRRWEYVMSDSANPYEFLIEVDIPLKGAEGKNSYVKAHIILHQNCVYEISLQKNFRGMFERLALLYGTQLPAFIICHFILILATQLKGFAVGNKSPSVFSSVMLLSPIVVVPFTKLSAWAITSFSDVETDFAVLTRQGRDLGILPIVLFLSSLPMSLVISFLTWILIVAFGNAAHGFTIKVLKRTLRSSDVLTDVAVAGLMKVPSVIAVGLMAVGVSTCGTLSLCLASGFYFIKIFKLYEDYLEGLLPSLVPNFREVESEKRGWQLSSINVHMTIMIIIYIMCFLNVPTLISWFKAVSVGSEFLLDPTIIPAIMCLVALGIFWQLKTINHQKAYYKELGYVVHAGAVFIILFGSIHLYRISFIVGFLLLLVAFHQLCAPTKPVINDTATGPVEGDDDKMIPKEENVEMVTDHISSAKKDSVPYNQDERNLTDDSTFKSTERVAEASSTTSER